MACGINSGGDILDTELFACSRRRRTINLLLRQFPKQHHIDSRDNHGNTALHVAAFVGRKDMATALLEAGANPNLLNSSGANPLDVLFVSDPPYLWGNPASKKFLVECFEAGRNDICMQLRSKGATHALPLAVKNAWATQLPYPWVRKMQTLSP